MAFTQRCGALRVDVSMGSVGDGYDNAVAESFFAALEAELLALVGTFKTHDEARTAVFTYLDGFYNTRRLHRKLGYRSSVEFERDGKKSTRIHRP